MKHNSRSQAYKSLTEVINQIHVETADKNTIQSLRNMLDMESFQPILSVIEDKIIEIGDYLKALDTVDSVMKGPEETPIDIWMGNQKKSEDLSNIPNVEDTESMEDLFSQGWAPFEYENENDVRYIPQPKVTY